MKGSLTVTRIPPGLGTQSSALSAPARVLGEAKAGPRGEGGHGWGGCCAFHQDPKRGCVMSEEEAGEGNT